MKLGGLALVLLFTCGRAAAQSDDLESAFQKLQEAETKKDAALVKKLAVETCAFARKLAATAEPADAAEKEVWKNHVAHARDIEIHTEYALYATAVQAPPPAMADLLAALEQQNPKSKYLNDAYPFYLYALNQTGGAAKIPAIAEKALANFPENEDLLRVLADTALNRKQSDRAVTYARKLVAVLAQHPKPEGLSAADWERKRTEALGRGYWIVGMVVSEKLQYAEADRNLRAALPLIKGNAAMLAPALYYLGVANYQLGKIRLNKAQVLEAAKFSEQSAAMEGPYAEHARHNALVMKREGQAMR